MLKSTKKLKLTYFRLCVSIMDDFNTDLESIDYDYWGINDVQISMHNLGIQIAVSYNPVNLKLKLL